MATSIDQLVDWRDFEAFVRDLYARHPDLHVEHNVVEVGKSGARRQTDIKFTHQAGGHSYVTLVECKRWKDPVSRDRVDVLASSMDDLNAAKGVMFTTAGYEAGAETYANHRGIELFTVRDLTDEEWGRPGKIVWFLIQYVAGGIANVSLERVEFVAFRDPPAGIEVALKVGPDEPPDPANRLFSTSTGIAGPNLIDLVLEARKKVLALIGRERGAALSARGDGALEAFVVPVQLDLKLFEYRELRREFGFGRLETISFEVLASISQRRFEYDRSDGLDLAVAVENFMTRQRQVVTRDRATKGIATFDLGPEEDRSSSGSEGVVENGSAMQVFLEPWVAGPTLGEPAKRTRQVTFSLPTWKATAVEASSDARSSS